MIEHLPGECHGASADLCGCELIPGRSFVLSVLMISIDTVDFGQLLKVRVTCRGVEHVITGL